MRNLFSRIVKRSKELAGRMEKTQEAITFAQADHPQLHEKTQAATPTAAGKLLVVGHETMFSQKVIDYALDMAQRMTYEIVALNAAPLSCDAFKPFAASQKRLCNEFQQMSEEHVQPFKVAAESMDIPFTHVVKFSEPDKALEMIQDEYKAIEFVITDEPTALSENRVTDTQRPSQRVYVYSMI